MNIHEYQAKELLKQYGVVVPEGKVAFSVEEAVQAAEEIGTRAAGRAAAVADILIAASTPAAAVRTDGSATIAAA